jgi:hypothetical protein
VSDHDRPRRCPSRLSLDRDGNVSDFGMIGVRVVRARRVQTYKLDHGAFMPDPAELPPSRWTGVWVRKSYAKPPIPPGYVYVNWYKPRGTPHGGWLREADLFTMP